MYVYNTFENKLRHIIFHLYSKQLNVKIYSFNLIQKIDLIL
jgi:hypothetical protein